MRKNKNKQPIKRKIAKTLELPEDMLCDIPRFILCDNRELQVENYKGILSYEETEIKLGGKAYKIRITGKELKITVITDEYIVIDGVISSLNFE